MKTRNVAARKQIGTFTAKSRFIFLIKCHLLGIFLKIAIAASHSRDVFRLPSHSVSMVS